jgi:hypothetical protein
MKEELYEANRNGCYDITTDGDCFDLGKKLSDNRSEGIC